MVIQASKVVCSPFLAGVLNSGAMCTHFVMVASSRKADAFQHCAAASLTSFCGKLIAIAANLQSKRIEVRRALLL